MGEKFTTGASLIQFSFWTVFFFFFNLFLKGTQKTSTTQGRKAQGDRREEHTRPLQA